MQSTIATITAAIATVGLTVAPAPPARAGCLGYNSDSLSSYSQGNCYDSTGGSYRVSAPGPGGSSINGTNSSGQYVQGNVYGNSFSGTVGGRHVNCNGSGCW